METHYTILEIQDTATPEEIKDSYRLLLQVWHPDRFHHRPALLEKAEEKSGKINIAFETLSDPVLKQGYDDWLRASGGWSTKAVESVTCPSCHTTIRPAHEQSQSWEVYERQRRATEERNRTTGATGQGNQPFPRAKTAMVAIGALFTVVIIFVLTKPSKIRISNKPPQVVAQESRPDTEPLTGNEMEAVSHAETARDGASNSPAQAHEQTAPSRDTPPTTPQQEGLDRLALTQRLMAKASVRVQAPPGEIVSDVDQQQLMRLATQGYASAQNQLGQIYATGRGVPQDYSAARKWYAKAAAQGNAWAQYFRREAERLDRKNRTDHGRQKPDKLTCYLHHDEVSSPGESHPEALSEPYVNLSAHTAPALEPRRTPICQCATSVGSRREIRTTQCVALRIWPRSFLYFHSTQRASDRSS